MKKTALSIIPNSITSLNLLAGCFAIVLAMQNNILAASVLIFIGGIFDFLDGLAARTLKAYSELGKMLDSMADLVTFGLAPTIILFQLIKTSWLATHPDATELTSLLIPSVSFLFAVCAALRLAKFNIDIRQAESFIGVPTPATAFFAASLPIISFYYPNISSYFFNVTTLAILVIILSALMVSEIPMLSFKFKNLNIKENRSRFILLAAAIILILSVRLAAYPFIFVFYVLLSIADNLLKCKSAIRK